MFVDFRCPIRVECILSCSTTSAFCPANPARGYILAEFCYSLTDFGANLRVRLCNFRPLDTGSKINPALNFVCGLRNPCLSSIQKGFVSNFKRFRYLGNFTCVRRSTKLASLQHTKISRLCHVLALSKMIQSEIYSAGLQFITLAQHL